MAMKVFEVEQGSAEWHQARAGVISASMFKIARKKVGGLDERQLKYVNLILDGTPEREALALAGYKAKPTSETVARALAGEKVGEPCEEAMNYALRLAIERMSGYPLQDEKFETYAMRRGHELEPEARRAHEALGVVVRRCGFVTNFEGRIGASTDGLIEDDGCSEYKCLVSPEGLRELLLNDNLDEFKDQLQGGLIVTGRKWMHFGLYCPALECINQALTIRVVHRDDDYCEELLSDLLEFDQLVEDIQARLIAGDRRNQECIAQALACIS
jgi:hypothetical protein